MTSHEGSEQVVSVLPMLEERCPGHARYQERAQRNFAIAGGVTLVMKSGRYLHCPVLIDALAIEHPDAIECVLEAAFKLFKENLKTLKGGA